MMSKGDYMQSLLADGKKPQTAAEKIPTIARGAVSDRAKETLNRASTYDLAFYVSIDAKDSHRSKDSSKKNASQQTPFSTLKQEKAKRDGTHGHQLSII